MALVRKGNTKARRSLANPAGHRKVVGDDRNSPGTIMVARTPKNRIFFP
jgi:hypothetical protein